MTREGYEVLALVMRYVFVLLGAWIVVRAFLWLRRDHRALMREMILSRVGKRDRELRVCFGKPEYSGDNAVGVALIGAEKLRRAEASGD